MSRYDWLLFLHLVSALSFVAAYTIVSVVLIGGRRVTSAETARALLRLARPADVLAWVGATGTLVFGVWLAVDVDAYRLWDGWILGALALWIVAEEVIRREDLFFRQARRSMWAAQARSAREGATTVPALLRSRHALAMHVVGSVALIGLFALMIFKPGAG